MTTNTDAVPLPCLTANKRYEHCCNSAWQAWQSRAASPQTTNNSRRTAEYWKAEHISGNEEIERLKEANKLLHEQLDTARGTIGSLREQATAAQPASGDDQ